MMEKETPIDNIISNPESGLEYGVPFISLKYS